MMLVLTYRLEASAPGGIKGATLAQRTFRKTALVNLLSS